MHGEVASAAADGALLSAIREWLVNSLLFLKVLIGFSLIVVVHELGHFLAAKWMGIRVDRFAIGFFRRVCGYRRGEGFTFGRRPNYTAEELAAKGYGETDYCINILPFGGYVKMLGEEDIQIDEQTGAITTGNDPRAFPNKPVGQRLIVVCAGVVFNLLFALLLFMFVFMVLGRQMVAPCIGHVEPGSPAANAGLLPGDRVLSINGRRVSSFDDVVSAAVLSGDRLRLRIERGGKPLEQDIEVTLTRRASGDREPLGILHMFTAEIAATGGRAAKADGPEPGDRIVGVDGRAISSPFEIATAFQNCGGREIELTVERGDPRDPGRKETLTFCQKPRLLLLPQLLEGDDVAVQDSRHLLGLQPRRVVIETVPGSPAAEAGFKPDDVIAQWGTVANPTYSDILASIYANDGRPIPVVVEREGRSVSLTVTPRRPFHLWRPTVPRVGVSFGTEEDRVVVADIAPDTPAVTLGMPRGSEILAINDRPVSTWVELAEVLRAAAGTTVNVRYRTGQDEVVARLSVPSSLVNELGLPPSAVILAIDGVDRVTLPSGKTVGLASSSLAVRHFLQQRIGQTVRVRYVQAPSDRAPREADFAVRPDNTDPWQMRVQYAHEVLELRPLTERVTAGGNPLRALDMGVRQTGRILWNMFLIVKNMATQNLGMQHVAGPIGIFRFAYEQAEQGLSDLLFFLAFLSINLAVINFIPLPVVDGGLVVFLLLEKLRGRPLSAKTQVITTLTGLAVIVLSFVFVTVQDITRLFGGS